MSITSDPTPLPVTERPAPPRRPGWGFGWGLLAGVLVTLGAAVAYNFFAHTLPAARDSVRVFDELNELRQQLNRINEEKTLKEKEKLSAVQRALDAVAAVRAPENIPEGKPADAPRVERARTPFDDIDEEIERLEKTQKVLNTILDVFSKKKER